MSDEIKDEIKDVPPVQDEPKGLSEEVVNAMIAKAVAEALANVKPEVKVETKEVIKEVKIPGSYKEDPDYIALMADLSHKRTSEINIKKAELKSKFGYEDADLEGADSLQSLTRLESIAMKSYKAGAKEATTEENLTKFLSTKADIVSKISNTYEAKAISAKEEQVQGKISNLLGFIKKK